jgi:hypothetical protein
MRLFRYARALGKTPEIRFLFDVPVVLMLRRVGADSSSGTGVGAAMRNLREG